MIAYRVAVRAIGLLIKRTHFLGPLKWFRDETGDGVDDVAAG
jgi:hypothetical protein